MFIAVGVVVPLLLLIIIIVGVGIVAGYIYYRKKIKNVQ